MDWIQVGLFLVSLVMGFFWFYCGDAMEKVLKRIGLALLFSFKEIVRLGAWVLFVYAFCRTFWHIAWPYSLTPSGHTNPNDWLNMAHTGALWYGASLIYRIKE